MSSNHQEPQQSSDDLGVGDEYDEPNETPQDHDWSRWSRSKLIMELEMWAVDANEPARMDQDLQCSAFMPG